MKSSIFKRAPTTPLIKAGCKTALITAHLTHCKCLATTLSSRASSSTHNIINDSLDQTFYHFFRWHTIFYSFSPFSGPSEILRIITILGIRKDIFDHRCHFWCSKATLTCLVLYIDVQFSVRVRCNWYFSGHIILLGGTDLQNLDLERVFGLSFIYHRLIFVIF